MTNLSFNAASCAFCPAEVSTRLYHAVAGATEVFQTIAKVARAALAGLVACLFLGKSQDLNKHAYRCWDDVKFSSQMIYLSLRGLIEPQAVIELKHQANLDYWDNRTVVFETSKELSYAEKVAQSLLYTSDFFEAGFGAGMAMIRAVTATALYPLSGGTSQLLPEIFILQTGSVGFHLFRMGVAAVGIVRPDDVQKLRPAEVSPN